MGNINNVNLTLNTPESILVAQQPDQGDGVIVLGATFTSGVGGEVINNKNKDQTLSTSLSTAAVINQESLDGVTSLNMLIIDKPTAYERMNDYTGRMLASSVVVAAVKRSINTLKAMNISLYFSVLDEYKPYGRADYLCSFYDNRIHGWSGSGCTRPIKNDKLNRFECSCDHLTTFALTWIPRTQFTPSLGAQDIASIISQSLSILCLLVVLVHASVTRVQIHNLLPLISTASSAVLFIFYIAFIATASSSGFHPYKAGCFTSVSVLMFFVYFFLIFMFCTKLSVSYFGYLRFAWPSSKSSFWKFAVTLIISLFISITAVACAAILESHSSLDTTELYVGQLCWFTPPAIHCFITIPVVILFLLGIVLLITFVARIIQYHRTDGTSHRSRSYARMKWCVLVLLTSFATQALMWLLGPIMLLVNSGSAYALDWFFVIFSGLEGVWSFALYWIIRSGRANELDSAQVAETPKETSSSTPNAPVQTTVDNVYHGSYVERTESERNYQSIQEDVVSGNTAKHKPFQ